MSVIFCWTAFAAGSFYFSTIKVSGETVSEKPSVVEDFAGNEEIFSDENNLSLPVENETFEPETLSANSQNFSRFSHTNQAHRSVSCLLCHRRDDNSARPRLPGHSPCIGCHTQQFSDPGNSQICLVCHTTTGSSALRGFPSRLRSFTVKFSHVVHSRARANCATCHSPAGRGATARSIPAGLSAHTTCFQCHTNRAQVGGRDISSCSTCHTLGRFSSSPNPSRAYNVGFNHNSHRAMNCAQCHTVSNGARGRQVSEPVAAMHFPPARAQSCASCHNNRRTFGGDDFSDCKICHTGNRFGL